MKRKSNPSPQPPEGPGLSGAQVRGGEIILRSRRRRIVFIAGLVGFVLLAILGSLFAYAA